MTNFEKCTFNDCPNVQYQEGFCPGHVAQRRAGKDLRPIGAAYYTEQTICVVEGCTNIAWSKQMCRGHYLRKRAGKPLETVLQHEPLPCGVEGCPKTAVTKGVCQSHYNKVKQAAQKKICSFDGCDRKHESKGFCKTHAGQLRRGQELKAIRTWGVYSKGEACLVDECPTQSMSKGLCGKHFKWADNYKIPLTVMNQLEQIKECQGCGATARLSIDHDHACCKGKTSCGKCVRGILCISCNATLGHAKDDMDRLKGLIEYLTN